MSIFSSLESLLKPLTTEFGRLPKPEQDAILSKYRLSRIEFALALELEELHLLAADIDHAVDDHRFAPLSKVISSKEEERRTVSIIQKLKRLICRR